MGGKHRPGTGKKRGGTYKTARKAKLREPGPEAPPPLPGPARPEPGNPAPRRLDAGARERFAGPAAPASLDLDFGDDLSGDEAVVSIVKTAEARPHAETLPSEQRPASLRGSVPGSLHGRLGQLGPSMAAEADFLPPLPIEEAEVEIVRLPATGAVSRPKQAPRRSARLLKPRT
jgi:hypothetical protein